MGSQVTPDPEPVAGAGCPEVVHGALEVSDVGDFDASTRPQALGPHQQPVRPKLPASHEVLELSEMLDDAIEHLHHRLGAPNGHGAVIGVDEHDQFLFEDACTEAERREAGFRAKPKVPWANGRGSGGLGGGSLDRWHGAHHGTGEGAQCIGVDGNFHHLDPEHSTQWWGNGARLGVEGPQGCSSPSERVVQHPLTTSLGRINPCAHLTGPAVAAESSPRADWTFLTNHAHVLVCIATEPDARGRDIAASVGITERATQAIISDLVNGGYVIRTREGRRNRYEINPASPLRHPLEANRSIGDLLVMLGRAIKAPAPRATKASTAAKQPAPKVAASKAR